MEIYKLLKNNPNESVLKHYENKEIEFNNQKKEFNKLWPQFESIDAALYQQKGSVLPKKPSDLEDFMLPDDFFLNFILFYFLVAKIKIYFLSLIY